MNNTLALALGALTLLSLPRVQGQDLTDIEVVEVTGDKQAARTLNPGDKTLSGLFGDGLTAAQTPRSVTVLSAELMDALNIDDLHDIVKAAPNAYASSGFGTPSLPSIRGQLGELFQDGVRRQAGNNGFGLPLSFNSVEQIDVVKGPSPVMFGSTQRNGGFVNLQTKRATTFGSEGTVTLRGARWDQYSAQLDYTTAIEPDKHGIRVSLEWLDHNSFYDYAERQSENVFIAYRMTPSNATSWDISAEYYNADYPDIAGINRPTQNLIDNGIYIAGQGVQSNGSTVPGAGAIISPTGEVRLPRNRVFTHPDDINGAQTTVLRSRYEQQLSAQATLRNHTYYQHLTREEIARNSFVEIIADADTVENRTEIDYRLSDEQLTTVGVALRYNAVLGYSQFTTEADNPVDLTGPLSNREIPLNQAQRMRLVLLRPGVYVSPGGQYDIDGDGNGDFNLSDTTDSVSWQTGLMLQQRSQWTPRLSTIAGVRLDYYDVEAQDPLAPGGQTRAFDEHTDWLSSTQLSATYQLTDAINLYAVFADNDATSNSMGGGTTLTADGTINSLNFATENQLYEVGIKYAPETNWYAEAALFDQTRSLRNRDGSNSGVATQGFEIQMFYEYSDYWLNASYSYLDARFDHSAAFQDTAKVIDAFDDSRPEIIIGTGVGSPSFTAFAPSTNRVQGVPPQIATVNGGWQVSDFLQLGFSAIYTKSFALDFLSTVKIRDQMQLDVSADYQFSSQLKGRIDVINVTDEENWQPVFEGGYFGATLAMPNVPRHAQVSLQYAF
ncbi:TonB-dependent receptor [Alteromonas ponticola]|uniref:TonB-dependent receptor n=1 Tax=Alteromonas ponticola TaxID=2720613 RepID=A0ABX1R315_9ALTE|nr:TonB-dependent receptor [Alteromonas ponticola]NMH59871.1 TonB-dependent receptor [Alteromonas ponticola]